MASNGSVVQGLKSSENDVIRITDRDMTRFWISLDYASDLTLHLLQYMNGGEVLIPKIPTMNVLEMLQVTKPTARTIDIPIRLGEKIHESMFLKSDCRNILEYHNYYMVLSFIA